MFSLNTISGLFAPTASRSGFSCRRGKTRLNLESLEGRDLMSAITGPPVLPPHHPPTMPPVLIRPPHLTPPPTSV
jgi:hypothetical protein